MNKKKVLFICLGNICRSPMAETIFNKIIKDEHAEQNFEVDSAGIIDYHEGEQADSRMRFHANQHGYKITHRSRQINRKDFEYFDFIVAMDEANVNQLNVLANTQAQRNKIIRMADYASNPEITCVPDPYYGGDQGFENVISMLEDACGGLFEELNYNNKIQI